MQLVSGEFFQVLRQQPQLGRVLSANDNVTLGGHPFAVISDRYWARQFRRTPDVVGKTLIVNEVALTIVGVAAPGFFGPILSARNPDVWVPLMMQSTVRYASNASNDDESDPRKPWPPQRGIEWLNVIARIPDANDVGAASTILTTLVRRDLRSRTTNPDEEALRRLDAAHVELVPAARGVSFLREEVRSPLLVLLGMVGVLLAIACGNFASLLIARGSARDREIAIRLSIGAGRGRVIRQLLVETLALAFAGGALGLLVAAWARDLLLAMFVPGATIIDLDTGFDWRVVGFAVAVTAVSGILAGIGPALRGTRVPLAESMKGEGRVVQGHGGRRDNSLARRSSLRRSRFLCCCSCSRRSSRAACSR